jgi:hypothetical protein
MKNIFKLLILSASIALIGMGCDKVGSLPVYKGGTASVLSSSAASIAASMADSNKTAITFSWTSPGYAADSTTAKYILEIDSSGRNFSKEVTKIVTGSLSTTFTNKELNNIALAFGFAYNKAYDLDIRVTSSYANNNDQLKSNTIKLNYTPYVVPPKVTPPSSKTLFMVGSATAGGWGNPVPTPAQQFTRVDSVTYQGTFFLNGGNEYLILPVNGDWSHKFSVANKALTGLSAGGNFGADLSDNIPGPATTGFYKILVDFQHGTFAVTPVGVYGQMWVPGDYQGWTPASAPTLGSAKNDGNYDGYVTIPSGGTYQFKLNTTPDWSNSFGDGGGGKLSSSGGNLVFPGAGYYHIAASSSALTYSLTKITSWSLIGSFAASGWSTDVDMTYDANNKYWTGTITTATGDQFKFRANHDWGTNLGESGGNGTLSYGGDNIGDATKNFAVPAGTHKITLFLNNSGYYTYMIQ